MSAVTGYHPTQFIKAPILTSHVIPNRSPLRHWGNFGVYEETNDKGEYLRPLS